MCQSGWARFSSLGTTGEENADGVKNDKEDDEDEADNVRGQWIR